MFTTYLIGILLVCSLLLIVLLVAPRPATDLAADRLPFMGIALIVMFGALAFIGGIAIGG